MNNLHTMKMKLAHIMSVTGLYMPVVVVNFVVVGTLLSGAALSFPKSMMNILGVRRQRSVVEALRMMASRRKK